MVGYAHVLPQLFLLVSLIGAAATASALVRGRRLGPLMVPYFFSSWLTGELAMHHLAWQAVATIAFVAGGALAEWSGVVGLAITFVSWIGLIHLQRHADMARPVFEEALRELDPETVLAPPPVRELVRPFRMRHPGVERIRDLAYGEHGARNHLDILRPRGGGRNLPVLVQIHGGAWVLGRKDQQGQPLMRVLASRGWLCVAVNYRLSPKVAFPDHLVDVKRALAWVREHGPSYGADPSFVAVTGGSAGGHLAALAALTANDPAYQPGFAEADTSVAACVPFYGIYDFLDRHGVRAHESMAPFLQRFVMKCSPVDERARWEAASPIGLVRPDAPPFLVIHGTHDALAPVEDARHFVKALRERSRAPVGFVQVPGAQHAFDVFHSRRSAYAVEAVARFLQVLHARYRGEREPDTPSVAVAGAGRL